MIVLQSDVKQGTLTVMLRIEPEEFFSALKDAYLERTDEYPVPGFAAGLASRAEIEKLYGRTALYDEALDLCVPTLYRRYLEENGLRTAGRPKLTEVTWLDDGAAFTVICDLYPDIHPGQYLGIETGISPEDKEAFTADVLAQACSRMAADVPEGMVQQKLDAMLAGEKLRTGQDAVYHLLADTVWILDQSYRETGIFRPKAQIRAEALDAMLQTVSGENRDPDLLRRLIRDLVSRYRPLPENFDERLKEIREQRSRRRKSMQPEERVNEAFAAYLGSIDMDEESWRRQNHDQAAQSARLDLLLNTVAEREKLSVTDSELSDVIRRVAEEAMLEPEEVMAQAELQPIREQILRDKARELILKNAVFEAGSRRERSI